MDTNPANTKTQHLKSQIAALEQLLEVYEKTVLEQSEKLYKEISERKHIEAVLRESEEKFRTISTSAKDAIIMIDNDGKISFWNEAAEKIFGYTSQEVVDKELHPLIVPQRYLEAFRKGFSKFKTTGEGPVIGKTLELMALRRDGSEFPVELSLSALKIKNKWCALGIVRDITERKHTEEKLNNTLKERDASMNNLRHLMEFSTTMRDETQEKVLVTNMSKALKRQFNPDILSVLLIDSETKMLDIPVIEPPMAAEKFIKDEVIFNPLLCRAINTGQEVFAKDINEGICCTCIQDKVNAGTSICLPLTGGGSTFGVVIMMKKEMGYWDNEQYKLMLGFIEIVTSSFTRSRLLEITRRASITDPLTGVYNRRFFDEMLEKQIAFAKRHSQHMSLLIMDIDHFKIFNDTYGHMVGDRVLQKLTKSVREIIRSSDMLSRYGGEEFSIIMPSADIAEALKKAETVRTHVETNCSDTVISGQSHKITISIGVASFPEHGADFNSLLNAADNALYKAKKLGRNRVEKL
ncbi:MAG TPA: sensor domain-containing diguanylate cyclase [Candidatus Wunengus sp. YC60]|uniref:sensor domain-containing diguanylate cyclase n=1 Tax=Candidatus Wunengus sp. YC60 TaxID=3367697 RepID=UPI004027A569